MRECGFWADPRDPADERPHPHALVDPHWDADERAVVLCFLAHRELTGVGSCELGCSFCRFGCFGGEAAFELGCCTMTDGEWAWPEALEHYVAEHAVRPPPEFVEHARRRLDGAAVAKATAVAREGGAAAALADDGAGEDFGPVWQWDAETNRPAPVPATTFDMLEQRSHAVRARIAAAAAVAAAGSSFSDAHSRYYAFARRRCCRSRRLLESVKRGLPPRRFARSSDYKQTFWILQSGGWGTPWSRTVICA